MPSPARATKAEKEARISEAMAMILDSKPKHEIKKHFAESYGLKFRQIESYISEARGRIVSEVQIDVDAMAAESYLFYQSIVSDKTATHKDRLKAREQIDLLYGLRKPSKHALTNADGTGDMAIGAYLMAQACERLEESRGIQIIDDNFVEAEAARLLADNEAAGSEPADTDEINR